MNSRGLAWSITRFEAWSLSRSLIDGWKYVAGARVRTRELEEIKPAIAMNSAISKLPSFVYFSDVSPGLESPRASMQMLQASIPARRICTCSSRADHARQIGPARERKNRGSESHAWKQERFPRFARNTIFRPQARENVKSRNPWLISNDSSYFSRLLSILLSRRRLGNRISNGVKSI